MKKSIIEQLTDSFIPLITEQYEKAETEEQRNAISQSLEKLDVSSLLVDVINKCSETTLPVLKEDMFKQVLWARDVEDEFLARLRQKWQRAFIASEAMYIMVLEVARSYSDRIDKLSKIEKQDKAHRYYALKCLHGRVLQQFSEIVSLMKNGFADGAYSRWRSIYELGIVSSFIANETEEVAIAFVKSSETDDNYNWAKASNKLKKYESVRFKDIVKHSKFPSGQWNTSYKLACKIVHPSSQGTFKRLGNAGTGTTEFILVGRSDYGMTKPGGHSAIVLLQVTALYLSLFPSVEEVIALNCIKGWVDFVCNEYSNAHDEAFPDVEPIKHKKET
ncbi:MAG TPA: DUF5677 domain-containing protein [Desulfuromonadaceae bacterium]